MATRMLDVLQTKGTHAVGNLNSLKVKTVSHGALVDTAAVDNFTIVELGFNSDGERICKQLSNKANKGYLIATPEVRYIEGEELVDFYNAVGDRARIVVLEPGYTRFDTSAFTLNAGVASVANGQVAHFDVTTKKFIISASGTPHADYATSKAKFLVVNNEADLLYTCGLPLVRLEVVEA